MKYFAITLAFLLSACATQPPKQNPTHSPDIELLLTSAIKKLSIRNTNKAIIDFDKAIALCEDRFSNSEQKVYASRSQTETLFYMLTSYADSISAIATDTVCSDALYGRGYATLDLGKIDLAQTYIQRAIDMAPVNSRYLSEMGHIIQTKRDWTKALEIFSQAEAAADTYSPKELKNMELARAKRGVGYSLIELGRLDEAEIKFKECIDINKDDKGALKELEYIAQLRKNISKSTK
mgnify:CR=1 FL=1